jgi:predicted lipid-binding transport protein (Tim44 family)
MIKKEGYKLKKTNASLFICVMLFVLSFSIPANANGLNFNQQTMKLSSKTFVSSKQLTSNQYAVRRSYRSNRSYRPTAPRPNYGTNRNTGRNFLGYAGAFGIGSLFGSMLNPFGGYYGGQHFGFSFFGLLLDILLIVAIIWFIKKIFRRNRRNY